MDQPRRKNLRRGPTSCAHENNNRF
uniref:Uncharacterized protein n=1 Tax=Rhizophora mucronata TaxID=61149 RepID=A0A2P2PTY5_RHIMU